ncbi:uncharacterized protein FIBRA_04676 [Fibroporia radiculosa]|uniref:Uncharacterized protein n=1 Tax=Fibroporia radiculosa TaxID=599839 RepID=J4G7R9_9APHY|nr:uncharacterized protein FIBRA_04676 [Fibroporia radiculosa]CCM02573.1 predicted protein [Fibroporia radiculosa]
MSDKAAEHARLSDFFSRLASGEHSPLSKELGLTATACGGSVIVTNSGPQEAAISNAMSHLVVPRRTSRTTFPSSCREVVEENIPENSLCQARVDVVLHSFQDLANFANLVTCVLTDSRSKYQPLPHDCRGKKVSIFDVQDEDDALRALKKRRMAGMKGAVTDALRCSDDPCSPVRDTFAGPDVQPSTWKEGASTTIPRIRLPSFSDPVSSATPNGNDEDPKECPGSYDEEVVLDYVRGLCERRVAQSRRCHVGAESDYSSPPTSASSTQTTFVLVTEGAAEDPSSVCSRPSMKRRLEH